MNQSDENLVKEYLSGHEDALKELIQRYLKLLYNFIHQYVADPHDVEDILQDSFVKSWRHLKKFKAHKTFKVWIFTITKNTIYDFLKKKRPLSFSALQKEEGDDFFVHTIPDDTPFPDELLKQAEDKKVLLQAMEKISSTSRAILLLYYQDGFNFREIAQILHESIDTVKSRHRRALVHLRQHIKK